MEHTEYPSSVFSVWQPKPQQNAKALRLFREGLSDMNDVLQFSPGAVLGQMRKHAHRLRVGLVARRRGRHPPAGTFTRARTPRLTARPADTSDIALETLFPILAS